MAPRRIVTGIDSDGRSVFLHDGPSPGVVDLGLGVDTEIWTDDPQTAAGADIADPAAVARHSLEPPAGGSKFRLWTFPPSSGEPPTAEQFAAALAAVEPVFDAGDALELDAPGFHTTRTVDYGVVLDGEVVLLLDEGEATLRVGDVVVQRGTRHAWENRSDAPCTMAFVLVSRPGS